MTLSLYSTYKALRRESAAHHAHQAGRPAKSADPIQNGVCHALSLLGLGVGEAGCNGDITVTRR